MRLDLVLRLLLLLALAACGHRVPDGGTSLPPGIVVVGERWVSQWDDGPNLDSPAYWSGHGHSWVLVTGKESHDLKVYDAATGDLVRSVGDRGTGPGQFRRPNGIAVIGDVVFVVERDNRRVQLLSLPDLAPLGWFGSDELLRPYGIAYHRTPGGELEIYVTDDYDVRRRPGAAAGRADLTQRVKHYRLAPGFGSSDRGGTVDAEWVRSFGEARGPGALRVVESIQIDPDQELLLVADEHDFELEAYDLRGRYLDRTVAAGMYRHGDPEGIMLYRCGSVNGYWILTDQGSARTVFHVLERRTFEKVGSFAGRVTANTDGIWLTQQEVPGIGSAALFALHDDGGVAAFAWDDIARPLGLRTDCTPR